MQRALTADMARRPTVEEPTFVRLGVKKGFIGVYRGLWGFRGFRSLGFKV